MFAVQFHGILPQNPLRAGAVVFKNGTKLFCSIIRARCNRTFTMFSLIPSAAAVRYIQLLDIRSGRSAGKYPAARHRGSQRPRNSFRSSASSGISSRSVAPA
jgi:hypothetical protein